MSTAISVIIPAYNAAAFLHHAIGSALHQTLPALEILVVDDGSRDETSRIAASYGAPVRCLRRDNGGLSAARNTGIQAARGEWLAFLDADDLWPGDHLACQWAVAAQTGADLVFSDARVVSPQREWESWLQRSGHGWVLGLPDAAFDDAFNRLLRRGSFALPSSVMVRREIVLQAGGFDEGMRPGPEDLDLWLRVASQTKWAFNRMSRVCRSEHDGNLTADRLGMAAGAEKLWLKMLQSPPVSSGRDQIRIMRLRLAEAQWEQAYWGLHSGQKMLARQAARRSLRHGWRWKTALYWALAGLPDPLTSVLFRLRKA